MPCRSDWPEYNFERHKEVARMLVWALTQLQRPVPKSILECTNNGTKAYREIDDLTNHLCSLIRAMDETTKERIIYNARSRQSRQLADWWEAHEEADRAREIKENRKKQERQLLESILKKCNPMEQEYLEDKLSKVLESLEEDE